MEKHNPEIIVTKNFLKQNPHIIYVIPGCVRSGVTPNIKFKQFEKLPNVVKLLIIDDMNSSNIEYCCDFHGYKGENDKGVGQTKAAIDSLIYRIKNTENYLYYIEDLSRLQCKYDNICLDCCSIDCLIKDEFERELADTNNVIFLWPKRP